MVKVCVALKCTRVSIGWCGRRVKLILKLYERLCLDTENAFKFLSATTVETSQIDTCLEDRSLFQKRWV